VEIRECDCKHIGGISWNFGVENLGRSVLVTRRKVPDIKQYFIAGVQSTVAHKNLQDTLHVHDDQSLLLYVDFNENRDLQRWVYECPDNRQLHRYAYNFHPTLGSAF